MPPTRVRPPLHRDAADDAGFTVVEALVSFVILMIVSAAGVGAIVNATAASGRSDNLAAASNLAQQNLQAARSLRYPDYPAPTPTNTPAPTTTVGSTTYTVVRTVSGSCPVPPDYDTNSSMIVTATVTWPGSGRTSVAMSTEIAC